MAVSGKLRELLKGNRPILITGAHNPLSAKLVQEAGFDGIWASGFEISASFGVPDANFLTMSENLEVCEAMANGVEIPIVADCDNGYGNAINVIRTAREFEKAGIAAICIEDNIFPKRCSFYAGVQRELVPVEEHVGKIKAAQDARRSDDFLVIARTEALIAGWGQAEALKRATAYAQAGADAVLVHSKSKTFDELKEFASQWTLDTPLVAVPTIYAQTTASELHEHGFKIVIYANHGLRSCIKAMRETFTVLKDQQYAAAVDDRVVPLNDVFEIIGVSDLRANEKIYLPAGGEQVTSIILAAGYEKNLEPLISEKPKGMLDIKGKSILERQVGLLNDVGVKEVAVVRGYKKEMIDLPNVRYYDNDRYQEVGELVSLFTAEKELDGRVVLMYGDILFERSVLERLLKSSADIALVVDNTWSATAAKAPNGPPDLVHFSAPDAPGEKAIAKIGAKVPSDEAHGEFIGMAMFSARGSQQIKEAYARTLEEYKGKSFYESDSVEQGSFTDLIQRGIDDGLKVSAVEITKGWMEVDTFEDYQRAWARIKK